ncbi:MAG: energy-coupling factor ABC transporter permease [Sedimentisphaerales bacterium]|nr:energy-coupling factor ABC transporter permease [Sedimentisphaerales bacterium]
MHMANELLSVPVAGATLTIAGGALAFITRRARKIIDADKLALMGILGAFVFAAQMVNFRLPAMPGTSGHLVGSVLLSIVLGPTLGAIVISSVIIIQCLIFQDGGLLALGCNIINMGIIPCYAGYYIFKTIKAESWQNTRTYVAVIIACVVSLEIGAALVPIEAAMSGVLLVPMSTFLVTMLGVHAIAGTIEGIVTAAVLGYLLQVRPDIIGDSLHGKIRLSKPAVIASLSIFTVITAAGLSLLASGMPDGLEWSYAERPDQSDFETTIANESTVIPKVDAFQEKFSLMPDYTVRSSKLGQTAQLEYEPAAAWTSMAGLIGAFLTMGFIWLFAQIIRKRSNSKPNPDTIAA